MPFGGLLSIAGPLISGGSALAGLFGGSPASNVQMPQMQNNYSNTAGADQGAYGNIGSLANYNVPAQLLPQYQQIAQQGVNDPYASQYMSNALQTGATGMQTGQAITGTAMSELPTAQALIQMGFDPQNALYAQQQNQNQQQTLAMLGQSGVAQTPYGQGVADQSNQNFNTNWENQQLGRAVQGAQGAGSVISNAAGNAGAGIGMMQMAGGLPYQTSQGITGNQLGLLGQAGQYGLMASQTPQTQIQDYLQYLQGATGQQGVNNQTAQVGLNQANMGFQQSQTMGNQLGQSIAGLGKGFGSSSPFAGMFGGGSGGGSFATNTWGQSNPGVAGSAYYGPTA